MPLSEQDIDNTTADAQLFKMADGGGMYLQVMPSGSKYWPPKYRIGGREKKISLGAYPDVSLEEAQSRHAQARQLRAGGVNPSIQRKKCLATERADYVGQRETTRFTVDSEGALCVYAGDKFLPMTAAETTELRAFLDATRNLTSKVERCL